MDFSIVVIVLLITGFGVINIFSATQKSALNDIDWSLVIQQLRWMVISLVVVYIILMVDYSILLSYANFFYWFCIFLLFCTMLFGKEVNGCKNWIYIGSNGIQPSEFAKIAMIMVMAKKLNEFEGNINNIRNFFVLAFYAIVPVLFLVKQPDMGMTMVCFFIVLGIVFISKLQIKIIAGGLVSLMILISLVWNSGLIKDYQKERFVAFLSPDTNQQTSNYQFLQSQMAIGSGGIFGRGFLGGTQVRSGAIPEVQTDFIFAVVGEEWGLIGAFTLLLMYYILLLRFIKAAQESKDIAGTVICTGVISYNLFSIFQNIGMTIGLMPITGITLPLMSYGGSSLLSNFIGISLVLNIGMRKKRINF